MNFKEVRDLLKMMNVDMNEHHAMRLFTVSPYTGCLHVHGIVRCIRVSKWSQLNTLLKNMLRTLFIWHCVCDHGSLVSVGFTYSF